MTLKAKGYKSSQEDWVAYSEKLRAVANEILDKFCADTRTVSVWDLYDALEAVYLTLSPDDDERGVLLRAKTRYLMNHNPPEGFVIGNL